MKDKKAVILQVIDMKQTMSNWRIKNSLCQELKEAVSNCHDPELLEKIFQDQCADLSLVLDNDLPPIERRQLAAQLESLAAVVH